MEPAESCLLESLEECVRHRHSIRFYTEKQVDPQILHECVALAQLAPSNSNIQPWRLHLAHGAARERIVSALKSAAAKEGPKVPPIPDPFNHYRSAMGRKLYGENGYNIGRDEPEKHKQATLRNYEFFGAPVCGVITMHSVLNHVDAMTVGMFIQTLLLALTEKGLGTCLQISVTGYPEVLRKEFNLPDEQNILCGIAIGYPDPDSNVNNLFMGRDDVDTKMILHHE